MNKQNVNTQKRSARDFSKLSRRILHLASRKLVQSEFLFELSSLFLDFSECNEIELYLKNDTKYYWCKARKSHINSFRLQINTMNNLNLMRKTDEVNGAKTLTNLCYDIINGEVNLNIYNSSARDKLWSNNTLEANIDAGQEILSFAIFPVRFNHENIGLLLFKSDRSNFFSEMEFPFYQDVAEALGIAFKHQIANFNLRERVKELTCLYNIATLTASQELSLDEILDSIVKILPSGWLYPEAAQARIVFEEKIYSTPEFRPGFDKLVSSLIVNNIQLGTIEVIYTEKKPEIDEGPFLKEERNLINTIAKEIGIIIERRLASIEKEKLKEQLRHADRLATIGQLAAGIAHELNEPLGSILGFAQLSQKNDKIPAQVSKDLNKVIDASLHAREIIKNLLVFARQTPAKMVPIEINEVVKECLDLLSGRMFKEGIKIEVALSEDIPQILADPSQINQVMVNLIVNSMQAMPVGGDLRIETSADSDVVYITVTDSGIGMDEQIIKQIFVPFFTTKDVNEGTGLGLAVVHGIVSSHGGQIKVNSKLGEGSKFEIQLPIKSVE